MQPNSLALDVDILNNGTKTTQSYARYQEFSDRSVYIGANHVPESRDMLGLYRTFPTRNGNFKGVSKSTVKFTADVEVPGVDGSTTLTSPVIFDLSVSIPVGTATADIVELRQRLIALLDDDSFMNSLQVQLMV